MKAISLAANPRTLTKTTGSKKVRQGGGLPGVIYGNGEPQSIETVSYTHLTLPTNREV